MIQVLIPTIMRTHTGGASSVQIEGSTITELISSLIATYPGLQAKLCDGEGNLHRHMLVVLNGEDIRSLQGPQTAVSDRDELQLLPAMAGG